MKNSPQVSETIEGRFLIFEVPNSEKLFQILYIFFSGNKWKRETFKRVV